MPYPLTMPLAVTGLGITTALGRGAGAFWTALVAGESGIRDVTSFDTSRLPARDGGEAPPLDDEHRPRRGPRERRARARRDRRRLRRPRRVHARGLRVPQGARARAGAAFRRRAGGHEARRRLRGDRARGGGRRARPGPARPRAPP